MFRPSFANSCPSLNTEGAGKAGCSLHPQPCVQNKNKHTSVITTGSDGTTRPSPRNGLTAYFVISPVERACCHRRRTENSAKLDASIAASGPHDLAVRFGVFVRRASARLTPKRPSHPLPNVRDDRETPLLRARDGKSDSADLGILKSRIFLILGLDF